MTAPVEDAEKPEPPAREASNAVDEPLPSARPEVIPRRSAHPVWRFLFHLFWVVLLPAVVAVQLVALLDPPNDGTPVGVLRTLVGEQKIPFGILFYTVLAIVLYRWRNRLPFAERCGVGGRRDIPENLQGKFEEASALLDEARRILRARRKEIAKELLPREQEEVYAGLSNLDASLNQEPFRAPDFEKAHTNASRVVGEHLARWRKGEIREYAESIAIAIGVALLLRGLVVQAFKIPSGSMIPTLLVGDHIFVNKIAYFESLPPDRADVMVFQFPENPEQDFIKRAIAIPGDTLAVVDGRPIINGWPVPHCHVGAFRPEGDRDIRNPQQLYVEYLNEHAYLTLLRSPVPEETCETNADCPRDTSCYYGLCGRDGKEYKVKADEVWVLGDARDNSHDSRSWNRGNGAGVPFENIRGRAMFVFATFGSNGSMFDRMGVDVMGRPRLPGSHASLQPALEKCLKDVPKQTQPPR